MPDRNLYLPLVIKFVEQDLAGAARVLEGMKVPDAADVLESLPGPMAVRVIKTLQIGFAAELLNQTADGFLQHITSQLDPQFLASILMHLPKESRERIRVHISGKTEDEIRDLLEYPQGSIGRIMTSDFMSFGKETLAHDAIGKIRSLAKKRMPSSYAYVVDDEQHLVGVLNMRDLMLASPQQSLESICLKDIFTLHCFTDVQEAANALAKRRYFAAPVVDSENHILGIIKAERLIKGVQEGTTQDIQRMFGVSADERPFSTIGFSLKKRLFWLNINLVTAFMAAGVVALFEGIIAKITILAVFLPVVAGQGGNAGAQSLAVVMRGIVMREIPAGKRLKLIFKEGRLGAINGTIIGAVTAAAAWLWMGSPFLGLVTGLGMLVNLFFAGLSGATIPLFMKQVGLDPAQSANIILTTVTDIIGFFAFLGFAVIFQQYLV
ncbi:magnesium transporter MgtE [Desulfosarcina widdelii]|uniref:Magnesium transporter MgtE n=1 Tax=Desulfosarcina widdelii TaxID=947919 RepID=A0A5K7ZHL9_9BACT|nr:magnesium transporter [Desulfosarcina widdelii]BBO75577.1 magnesium transporter MgtE [Desulfosarcina widdelii]